MKRESNCYIVLASSLLLLHQFCEILPLLSAEGLAACSQHWLSWGDSCYRAYKGPKSWNDSLTFCRENQADLASLNSAEENQFVLQNVDATKGIWIGLVKDKKLGLFRWTSEENVVFKNWQERLDTNGDENCGEMVDYTGYQGKWNDKKCSAKLAFICEKKAEILGQYLKKMPEKRLINHVLTHVTVSSDLECIFRCRRHGNCSSVNHSSQSSQLCELNSAGEERFPEDLKHDNNYDYLGLIF
ncbi:C-type lectin BpLec-like [Acropora muricata]|uniref:C-type lectin BpLec-like n=1 Tax=Acropora muricata TaxID=159855 RepID=UPI0034E517FB